jgi:hypothetical protein
MRQIQTWLCWLPPPQSSYPSNIPNLNQVYPSPFTQSVCPNLRAQARCADHGRLCVVCRCRTGTLAQLEPGYPESLLAELGLSLRFLGLLYAPFALTLWCAQAGSSAAGCSTVTCPAKWLVVEVLMTAVHTLRTQVPAFGQIIHNTFGSLPSLNLRTAPTTQ